MQKFIHGRAPVRLVLITRTIAKHAVQTDDKHARNLLALCFCVTRGIPPNYLFP